MSAIMLPPFPSQDLAKLVLGYLAEEQLMTAYDEFLQASPYLDALRNEYDRIFMTSLKNILAEYRAVKIYVETCKPIALRRKLFQCPNLLEIVKFLIHNIDVNKIQTQETSLDRTGPDKPNITTSVRTDVDCQVCNSQKLANCVCVTRHNEQQTIGENSTSSGNVTSVPISVETTPLSDLPGNHVSTRKKYDKMLVDNGTPISHYNTTTNTSDHETSSKQNTCIYRSISDTNNPPQVPVKQNNAQDPNFSEKVTEMMDSRQKIDEFNDILNLVCNKNNSNTQTVNNNERISNAGTFQEFATGVSGDNNDKGSVPDSSSANNINLQIPVTNETNTVNVSGGIKRGKGKKTQYLLKVASVKDPVVQQTSEVIDVDSLNLNTYTRIKPKSEESKVKIISDVIVDKETLSNSNMKMPAVLKNATSTPLLQMRTIVINGTSAYKSQEQFSHSFPTKRDNYTKDEIMAMPTIIITPGAAQNPVNVQPQTTIPQKINAPPPMNNMCIQSIMPLIIDVTASTSSTNSKLTTTSSDFNIPETHQLKPCSVSTLVKTVDVTSASVPKDNVIACSAETSTPQMVHVTRKSSSTPRRSSHIRVLDFTTPRRILHETRNECGSNPNSGTTEVVLSSSPNLTILDTKDLTNENTLTGDSRSISIVSSKENTTKKVTLSRKSNWDADLRALLSNDKDTYETPSSQRKKSNYKKKKLECSTKKDNTDEKTVVNKKVSKAKIGKKSPKKDIDKNLDKIDIPVKPTINIVSATDKGVSNHGNDKNQNKSNEEHDTPDLERMSLQNVIGSRLNISDFLETPYKQALYDIQMETPRFLGPDLPDEPMSDIKIMNIPTPRFLNTSKSTQATPSSYSSRPTDYSSGGSYYKPDDQDYIPNPENFGCSGTSSKENLSIDSPVKSDKDVKENTDRIRSSRPVRKCAKNVSYYNSNINKTKDEKTKDDRNVEDVSSDLENISSCSDKKSNKENTSKVLQENTSLTKPKSEKRKRSSSKKLKSPKKEVVKSFMKIKPRRPTPTKVSNVGKSKRKTLESSPNHTATTHTRKRTSSKEKQIQVTPAVIFAPTKSRRKSSTPRKLNCTKSFNSESSGHNSPDLITMHKQNPRQDTKVLPDSDTERVGDGNTPPLRWSDDGSQDVKPKEKEVFSNEIEDITKIQEYIETTVSSNTGHNESEGSLHNDLVKRGFDIETARIIERDLLDTPPYPKQENTLNLKTVVDLNNDKTRLNKDITSESVASNNSQTPPEEQDEYEDEIEFSVCECNEESTNYLVCQYDETKDTTTNELTKLKDKFTMEVCIDDGVLIRLKATPFSMLLDLDPKTDDNNDKETIEPLCTAVTPISKYDSLYTPLKQSVKAQCYDIFDSTLTSLDTPLKAHSPKQQESEYTVTEIVLEVEKVDDKEKPELKKRKRNQSGNTSDESVSETKKSKSDPQYLFNSANIQNIDIESVLSKLHGP
ncbi:LOW QUALITY PROTEIN: uncharacterized protein ACR2FA_011702 [Aphomia sociella]